MSSANYDVLDLERLEQNPFCNHGPTILFSNEKKKFYSCSACRDHKLCSFYAVFEDRPFSDERLKTWHQRYLENQPNYSRYEQNLKKAKELESDQRKYCRTCNNFVFEANHDEKHDLAVGISDEMLNKPISSILQPIELNSSNAQFLFDESTTQFIVDVVKKFSFDSVMCVGTPSIFEKLEEVKGVKRILLDIDDRFGQFYEKNVFVRFNMFNAHFFNGNEDYLKFITNSKKVLLIIDPPYGGIVKLIANTIQKIKNDFKNGPEIETVLFYPYFMEFWINKWLPELKMIDYKVSYLNQRKLGKESTQKKGSIARIFTSLKPKEIELPKNEGYSYCKICEKFTYKENKHCNKCKKCPSKVKNFKETRFLTYVNSYVITEIKKQKDGGLYKHCTACKRCVKNGYKHCEKCNTCHLETLKDCKFEKRTDKRKKDGENETQIENSKFIKKIKK